MSLKPKVQSLNRKAQNPKHSANGTTLVISNTFNF